MRLLLFLLLAVSWTSAPALPPLQLYVELTPAGGTLRPEPGTYSGPVVIRKPITIEGEGEVTIDAGGEGTVLSILADGATVRGLHLTHSGTSHDSVDAGILVKADRVTVENNLIDESLFGIHLSNANDNVIRNNRISSLTDRDISIRGDAIRVWYSHGNLIENNEVSHARDLVFSNAAENRIVGNRIRHSRISMEFVYSPDNEVTGNRLEHNFTGVTVIYSEAITLSDNSTRVDDNWLAGRVAEVRRLDANGTPWMTTEPIYRIKPMWRVLLNGKDISYAGGTEMQITPGDELHIFPPGR
ncbi:MAG: hypothetical protein DSZ00_03425 [Gammaproteobacteria bacterium]|nr:MAG: hypothetical protein DSZ00_03425 [Gammaproteobacteria bacterium]